MPSIGNDVALMESLKTLPDLAEARRMSLCLFIGICTAGVATLTVNQMKRVVSYNNVMVITDESVLHDLHVSEDFDGFGFFISYKFLNDVLKDVHNMSSLFMLTHNHPVFELLPNGLNIARQYFDNIYLRIQAVNHPFRREVVRLIILTLIYDFAATFQKALDNPRNTDRQTRGEHVFTEFMQLVEDNYREQRQVKWYAEQMNMTPKYLCEVVSSVSRRSPSEWIDKFVCSEIRNLLRHTDKRMKEIADELNFPNQSFFGKYFKENVGVSPSDYRNGIEL